MPRFTKRIPSYRLHRPSGQAVVTLSGRDQYLGRFGSQESRAEYNRYVAEWLAASRTSLESGADTTQENGKSTLNEAFLPYWEFTQQHYRKHGRPTSELALIKLALAPLLAAYGTHPATCFGPLALKAYRQELIQRGISRGVINQHVGRVKRFFKWMVSNEMAPTNTLVGLQSVTGLQRGRTPARETEPVKPVPDLIVDATLPHLNRQVATMVRLQRLTGMRPGEVTSMRSCHIDTSGSIWAYRPESHKTEHRGRQRVIWFGPQAQEVLRPWLKSDLQAYLFSPAEAEAERHREQRARRQTPMTPSQAARQTKAKPRRKPSDHYTTSSYEHCIVQSCRKAFPPPEPLAQRVKETKKQWLARLTDEQHGQVKAWRREHRWAPNRLRHNAATFLRKQYGIEAARVILGHSSAAITEIYAELDQAKAAQIMSEVG